MRKRSVSELSLSFISLRSLRIVELHFLVLIRFSKLVSSRRKKKPLRIANGLLEPTRSFNGSYKRKRRSV